MAPSSSAVVEPRLVTEERSLARVEPQTDWASMFERLATNPAVDVGKLTTLVDLRDRVRAQDAKADFDAAYAKMQSELPEISERGQIKGKGGEVRSRYAKLEDINDVVRPILKTHGFAIRHRTEWPADKKGIIRIVGILSHEHGHSEESAFEAPMDQSDYRTDIQSMGSTVSYGRRYTTIDLLNIVTRAADDDGVRGVTSARRQGTNEPAGYRDWLSDMETVADDGTAKLRRAWQDSKREYTKYLTETAPRTVEALKAKAEAATRRQEAQQ